MLAVFGIRYSASPAGREQQRRRSDRQQGPGRRLGYTRRCDANIIQAPLHPRRVAGEVDAVPFLIAGQVIVEVISAVAFAVAQRAYFRPVAKLQTQARSPPEKK